MSESVSNVAIIGMIISGIVAIVFPVILLIYWQKSKKPNIASAVIGMAAFLLFALTLEQILHVIVMTVIGGGDMLKGNVVLASNIWIYGLYGGACAAIFEEFGRLLAMKIAMKSFLDKKNAIMYGIGHGGIESIVIVGFAEISNIITSLTINSGSLDTILSSVPDNQRELLYNQLSALWMTPAVGYYMAGVERISAVFLHICLSYLVYRFVRYNEKKSFITALAIHFAIDFATVLLASALPMYALEIILAVAVLVLCIFVVKKYKSENEDIIASTES